MRLSWGRLRFEVFGFRRGWRVLGLRFSEAARLRDARYACSTTSSAMVSASSVPIFGRCKPACGFRRGTQDRRTGNSPPCSAPSATLDAIDTADRYWLRTRNRGTPQLLVNPHGRCTTLDFVANDTSRSPPWFPINLESATPPENSDPHPKPQFPPSHPKPKTSNETPHPTSHRIVNNGEMLVSPIGATAESRIPLLRDLVLDLKIARACRCLFSRSLIFC